MPFPPSLSSLSRSVDRLPSTASRLLTPARAIAFWTAVALPFSYLPLFAFDVSSLSGATFSGLIAINVVALIVGHSYRR